MAINRGKAFEDVVRESLEKIPDTYVLRLYDPEGGYSGVSNPCDFIVSHNGTMYMLECKAIHGNLLSINSNDPKRKYGNVSNTQWEGMLKAVHITDGWIVAGVLIWWVDHDVTKFVPIQELDILKRCHFQKSVKYDIPVDGNLDILEIAGTKKRVYFDYDFTGFFEKYDKGT